MKQGHAMFIFGGPGYITQYFLGPLTYLKIRNFIFIPK